MHRLSELFFQTHPLSLTHIFRHTHTLKYPFIHWRLVLIPLNGINELALKGRWTWPLKRGITFNGLLKHSLIADWINATGLKPEFVARLRNLTRRMEKVYQRGKLMSLGNDGLSGSLKGAIWHFWILCIFPGYMWIPVCFLGQGPGRLRLQVWCHQTAAELSGVSDGRGSGPPRPHPGAMCWKTGGQRH